jgi:TRAP-type C4-dicarboxylate transport system permease small subunit
MTNGRSWIDKAEALTRAVNRTFALIGCILVMVIVLIIVREVVMRYGFNAPSTWTLDVSRYLLLFTFFLALAPALESGHHVHVDLFDPLVPPGWHHWQQISGWILVVFFGAVLFWYVLDVTVDVFETDELSFSVIPIKLKHLYWIGPVGALQFLLTGCVRLARIWTQPPTATADTAGAAASE